MPSSRSGRKSTRTGFYSPPASRSTTSRGFGDKRLLYILKGIEDITTDYAERAGKDYYPRSAEEDRVSQMMQEELLSRRNLHIVIKSK